MKKLLCILIPMAISLTIQAQKSNLFPVQIKEKWGYTNVAGKLVIAAVYDYAEPFFNNRAVVALANQPCVINEQNKRIIDTGLYTHIQHYSECLARVTTNNKQYHFVDTNGIKVLTVDSGLYDARPFNNGLSCVAKELDIHENKFNHDIAYLGYYFGFINKTGKPVIELTLDDVDDFKNGLARFRKKNLFGVIDTTGKEVIKAKYHNMGVFAEGLAVVDFNGKYGYVNTVGTEVILPTYEYASDFSEGLAGVKLQGKYGFINQNGVMVISPQFESVRPFANGVAAVKLNGKWGFINASGTLVLRHVFDNATYFSSDRCAVQVKRKWGFIDMQGNLVIPAEFDAVGTFANDLAEVQLGNLTVYVNRIGQIIPVLK